MKPTPERTLFHILYVPWTGLGLHAGYRGDAWLVKRIEIFKKYVLPSLLNQTEKRFTLLFSFRAEEKENPLVQEFVESLANIRGLALLVSYHGVLFWDDKYPEDEASHRLRVALERTLPELAPHIPEDVDDVYFTIQPSDDMYLADAVEKIQRFPQKAGIQTIGFTKGYLMNYATKAIAEYNPDTIPPFSTIIFPRFVFLDAVDHYYWTGPYESHEFVPHFEEIPGRGFVVGTHGANISTTFNHPYKGRTLRPDERDSVLVRTGTLYADPVRGRSGLGLLARKLINRVPFQATLRALYYKQPWRF